MIIESIFTDVTVTGFTVYGLALLFIKASLILLLAQIFSDSFEFSTASLRHTVWLIALVSLAALPLLTFLLPAWRLLSIDVGPELQSMGTTVDQFATTTMTSPPVLSIMDWLVIAYLLVAGFRLAYLSFEIIKVGWVTAKSNDADNTWYEQSKQYFDSPLRIKISADIEGPVTWGALYPVILLPEDCKFWLPLEKEIVLRHELSHIRRHDWLAQLLAQLVVVLYWPVPGVSRALRSLSLESERACDDLVLLDGVAPADYAALLLRQARVHKLLATVALGVPSELAQRVRHIVSFYVDRAGERKTRCWLAVSASLFILPFAAVQAVGSLSQEAELSGWVLIPIVMNSDKKPSSEQVLPVVDINRPLKPEMAISPPSGLLFDDVIEAGSEHETLFVPQVITSPNSDLALSDFSAARLRLKTTQQPDYPIAAQRRGIQGRVIVEFDINTQGHVINPKIVKTGASSLFHRSVLKAISGYQYEPYRLGGQIMGLQGLKAEFIFQLTEGKPNKRNSSGDSRAGQQLPINSS